MNYPTLKNPPIREAVIEFLFPDIISEPVLHELVSEIPGFPERKRMQAIQYNFNLKPEGAETNTINEFGGMHLMDNEEKTSLQVRLNGISYHSTGLYPGWDKFTMAFLDVWNLACVRTGFEAFGRAGVRFINELPLENTEEIADSLKLHLDTGKGKWPITGLFWRTVLDMGNGFQGSLALATNPGLRPPGGSLIVDCDISKTDRISMGEIGDSLRLLRSLKNELFYSTITDKVIKQCQ